MVTCAFRVSSLLAFSTPRRPPPALIVLSSNACSSARAMSAAARGLTCRRGAGCERVLRRRRVPVVRPVPPPLRSGVRAPLVARLARLGAPAGLEQGSGCGGVAFRCGGGA